LLDSMRGGIKLCLIGSFRDQLADWSCQMPHPPGGGSRWPSGIRIIYVSVSKIIFLGAPVPWACSGRKCAPPDFLQPARITREPTTHDSKTFTMGVFKRKFSDYDGEASGSNSIQIPEAPSDDAPPKRQKSKTVKKAKAKPENLNWVKKRARTIERKFRAGQNIPANIENDLERELEHHKQKIIEAEDDKKRTKMLQKYKMVRFFGM
jgi:hypothetical protein